MKDELVAVLKQVTPESFARALLGLDDGDDIVPYSEWLMVHFDARMDKACRYAAKVVPSPKFDGPGVRKSFVAQGYLKALVEKRDGFARTIRDRLPMPWVARHQWIVSAHG
jgi:hypothetical protein